MSLLARPPQDAELRRHAEAFASTPARTFEFSLAGGGSSSSSSSSATTTATSSSSSSSTMASVTMAAMMMGGAAPQSATSQNNPATSSRLAVTALQWSPDGRWLCAAGDERRIRMWSYDKVRSCLAFHDVFGVVANDSASLVLAIRSISGSW